MLQITRCKMIAGFKDVFFTNNCLLITIYFPPRRINFLFPCIIKILSALRVLGGEKNNTNLPKNVRQVTPIKKAIALRMLEKNRESFYRKKQQVKGLASLRYAG